MQGFYDSHARKTKINTDGNETDEPTPVDRREKADRRKKDRRTKPGRKASNKLLQPILTQAEIAALLRGAR